MNNVDYVVAQCAEEFVKTLPDNSVHLLAIDPPYFHIVDEVWDHHWSDTMEYARWLFNILRSFYPKLTHDASVVFFGAIGKRGERPLFEVMRLLDGPDSPYFYRNLITWQKRRAYGKSHDYLFCREEIVWYSCASARTSVRFNIPLTSEKRGYAGYAEKAIAGYVNLGYHIHHEEKRTDFSHVCLSPGAQAQSKRSVLQLLRQSDLPQRPWSEKSETRQVVCEEQRPSKKVHSTKEDERGSNTHSVSGYKKTRKDKGVGIHIDRRRFEKSLDQPMSSAWDIDPLKHSESGRFSISRQNRQFCWVCTEKYTNNIASGKQAKKRCDDSGSRINSSIYEESLHIESIAITENKVKYPAKSPYKRVSNVWSDIPELMRPERPCQKPVELMRRIVNTHSNQGDLVVDCFAGYGTTGIACAETGRLFVGCEGVEQDAHAADVRVRDAFELPRVRG